MKIQLLIILLFPLLLIGQSNQVIDTLSTDMLQRRNGLLYKIDKDEPFTGIHADKWSNGQKKSVHHIANGKEYGISLAWNEDGQITEQVDILNARRKSWRYEDNQKIEYNDTLLWSRNIGQWKTKSQTNYDINGEIIKPLNYTQIEFKNNLAYTKLDNKLFTGVMTFQGELMLYDTHYYFKDRLFRGEVSFISGDFDGPYYSWYLENDQKRFEANLKNRRLHGPYTSWWYNGNKETELSYSYGRKNSIETRWLENGQIMSKGKYNGGDPDGLHTTWNENGVKQAEITYLNNKEIKVVIWDEKGNKLKEWPEIDEDKYGLRVFSEKLISILKSKNYDAIEDLYISKETLVDAFKDPSKEELDKDIKQIIDQWPEYMTYIKEEFKKAVDNELYESYLENAKINSLIFDYNIIQNNLDHSSIEVKWPESMNYDLSTSRIVYASTKIILDTDEEQVVIGINPIFFNNKWWIFLMERDLIGINIQY